ncbi:MAG: glycoside hydrolase family 99-like domain-containing protein, partial [Clostridiales bacterium]|nr:glycoside hydrolase family 99-like domain-containing protein [Clostridiales bacterium]
NGLLKFQPQEVYNSKNFKERNFFSRHFSQKFRFLPERYIDILHFYKQKFEKHRVFNSNIISDYIIQNAYQKVNGYDGDIYESIYVNWDNTPRYNKKATIFTHKDPVNFQKELLALYEKAEINRSEFIFINAWNEWAESAYLEPDMKYKYEYLDAVSNVIGESKLNCK